VRSRPAPITSPKRVVSDPNEFEQIISHIAERLNDAPGAARLARLAKTAKRIPEALLERLAELIVQLDDPHFVGNDIFIHLIEVGYCDAKVVNATAFASALAERLERYLASGIVADAARGDFRERAAWWRMALSRAGELSRWPAIILAEKCYG